MREEKKMFVLLFWFVNSSLELLCLLEIVELRPVNIPEK